jgi:hypothetical protein
VEAAGAYFKPGITEGKPSIPSEMTAASSAKIRTVHFPNTSTDPCNATVCSVLKDVKAGSCPYA